MIKLFPRISAVVLALLLAACAAPGAQAPGSMEVRQGVIEQITPMDLQSSQHTGVAAALYVEHLQDPVVLAAVNDLENLTAGLSRKIWQKITILDTATR